MLAYEPVLHDVWSANLDDEIEQLRQIAVKATHVISSIEFPGMCLTPMGTFYTLEQYSYQQLLVNVNGLKPIQFGLAFVHESAHLGLSQMSVYQFNLRFNKEEDMYTDEAIQAYDAAGVNLHRHNAEGIDLLDLGELLTTSGVIASHLTWVSFHSAFDFGFLTRSLCGGALPADVRDFYKMFRKYFKVAYDVKQLLRHPAATRKNLKPKMSLQEVATTLKIGRTGVRHQAASDSILAARIFFNLKSELSAGWSEISQQINGLITGVGGEPVLPQGAVIQAIFTADSAIQNSPRKAIH